MRFENLLFAIALVAASMICTQGLIEFPPIPSFKVAPNPAPPTWMTINTEFVFPCYDPQGNIIHRFSNADPCPHFKRGKRAMLW